jgi:glutamyl-tRNA reductase
VSRAAVQLARGLFDRLDDRRALVIGAGDAGRMVARALTDAGVQQIAVVNRTHWRAQDLARELGGVATPFENLGRALADADLVISSTGSPGYVVDEAMVAEALTLRRSDEPMMLIDIAVPRDIEPSVGDLDRARLFDIDALAQVAEVSLDDLAGEVQNAGTLVDAELARFSEWWHSSDTMELVVGVRQRADAMRRQEVARTLQIMGEDKEGELAERLHAMTNALVKKLLHQPTVELRSGDNTTDYRVARRLFGYDDDRRSRR